MTVRVLVVADKSLARGELAVLAGESEELEIVGTCGPQDVARLAGELEPDAVLLVGGLGGRSIAEVVLLADEIPVPVIVINDTNQFAARPSPVEPTADLLEPLTQRELEVLQLLAVGLTNRRIAHALEISEHTVKFHVAALMGKLGASTRTEAVTLASRHGLILI